MITPIIMAGGRGKRLYPISTEDFPKQFHRFFSEYSLLQNTILRLNKVLFAPPIILTNVRYSQIIHEQMREISCVKYKLISEEVPLGTSLTIARVLLMLSRDDVIIVLPSDHHIGNASEFEYIVKLALNKHTNSKIINLSTLARYQSGDYGYIFTSEISDIMKVVAFKEKPNTFTTNLYNECHYFWNTGIVLATVGVLLDEFDQISPDTIARAKLILTDKDSVDSACYNAIDNAIMQSTDKLYTVLLQSNWYDFGSLAAIFDFIKQEYLNKADYETVERAWGEYTILFKGRKFVVKKLVIFPKSFSSLQFHQYRDECLQMIKGSGVVALDGRLKHLFKKEIIVIERNIQHKIINNTDESIELLEIQSGDIVNEEDIIRVGNAYCGSRAL